MALNGNKLLPMKISIGEKYGPAMEITDQAEADAYFALLVEHGLHFSNDRAHVEEVERANLGYYAGYYGSDTRARVERLFKCAHPIFGAIAENGEPRASEALMAGFVAGAANVPTAALLAQTKDRK